MRQSQLVREAREMLAGLKAEYEKNLELLSQVPRLAAGLGAAELAELVVAVRDARDVVSTAKTLLTKVQAPIEELMCRRVLEAQDDPTYRTDTHTFSCDVRGFFGAPSPTKHPAEFAELMKWLREKGRGDLIEATPFGVFKIEQDGFVELCQGLLASGENLPPHTKEHLVPAVRVTARRKAS